MELSHINKIVFLMMFFLAFSIGVNSIFAYNNWIIDGNRVYVDDSKVYISVEPHTLHSSGWIYLNFTSKVYTGDIDMVWGFNTKEVRPKKAELYHPHNISWETTHSKIFYNMSGYSDTTEPCEYGYEYNTYKKLITYTQLDGFDNQTNETIWSITTAVVCFDSYEDLGNNDYKITWHQEHTRTENWLDVSDRFESVNYEFGDMDKWYYITNIPIEKNVQYTMRAYIEIPVWKHTSGKYWVAFKPSSETIGQAISNGHLYYLDPWWNTSWQYRKPITIDSSKIDSDLTDFPVLVKLNSSNIDYSKTQDSGQDIRFVAWDNTTELDYEIELWNESGNSYVWVKIPSISSSSDTKFWIYYNNSGATDEQNPSGVWSNGYVAVYHFSDGGKDSLNQHNGTIYNNPSQKLCEVGKCYDYTGSEYISIPHHSDFTTDNQTVETFFTYRTNNNYPAIVYKAPDTDWHRDIHLIVKKADSKIFFWEGNSTVSDHIEVSSNEISTNVWYYGATTKIYNGTYTTVSLFVDDEKAGEQSKNFKLGHTTANFTIGASSEGSGDFYDGLIDEVRVSNIPRSSAWINASYYSLIDSLITYGSEEILDITPPSFSNWQQEPPDLNSSSLGKLYINVTITDDSGINESSVKFYHWINDSQYPNQPWCFINGTAGDFEHEHEMTNITSSIFNITLHTYAYNPSTHNVHPDIMRSATKYNYSLNSNNKALKVRFYNISTHPNTTYILKPRLYRNSGNLLIYYCNESYTIGKVYNSDYCVPLTTLTSQVGTTYQNTYFYGDENSYLDGVKITSTGYIIFYALPGSDWEVVYANINSNSLETTGNGGTSWTNQDYSADTWLIQLNGNGLTTVGYKVYACDNVGNCGNSSIQEDTYAIHNLAPSPAPEIIVPENSTYSGTFNITWEPSKDPNNDPFNYSLYLYHSDGTLASVLADNNITEGTEYYIFNSTNYPDGQYYLMANATDNESNTNFYIMPYLFTIDNILPTTTTILREPINIPDNTQKDLIMIFLVALFIMIFFFLPFTRRR